MLKKQCVSEGEECRIAARDRDGALREDATNTEGYRSMRCGAAVLIGGRTFVLGKLVGQGLRLLW